MGVLTNIALEDLAMRSDFGQHTVLAFKQDHKRVDYIGSDCTGPIKEHSSVISFERLFSRVSVEEPAAFLPKFMKSVKRAYLPEDGVAQIIMELIRMATLGGRELQKCTTTDLITHYNVLRQSEGFELVSAKAFKTKTKLMEAIVASEARLLALTPAQLQNRQVTAASTEKRLSGLAPLKEQKAEDAAAKRATKAAKASSSKESIMAITTKKTAPAAKTIKEPEAGARPAKLAKAVPAKPEPKVKTPTKPEPKAKAAKAVKEPSKGGGVGAFCMDLILDGKSNEEVAVPAKPEPKAKATKAAKEPSKGGGVGAFCMDLILDGKSNEEVAEAARNEFGGKTSASSVAWYRNKLKGEGKL